MIPHGTSSAPLLRIVLVSIDSGFTCAALCKASQKTFALNISVQSTEIS
jgi:hypothetical protein